jgi:hypothetical protein
LRRRGKRGGPIKPEVLGEASLTGVYIADLTGNDPNVYLELGVRWPVKDRVTIIVSQDIDGLLFNVSGERASPYVSTPKALNRSIQSYQDGHPQRPQGSR